MDAAVSSHGLRDALDKRARCKFWLLPGMADHLMHRLQSLLVAVVLYSLTAMQGYAAIAYRSANSASITSGTTLTVTKPSGTVAGDVLVATVMARPSGVTFTAPSGWVLVRSTTQSAGPSLRFVTYYKVAGASEPASYSWTLGGSSTSGAVGGIGSFSGVSNSSPINAEGGNTTPYAYTHTANSITTTSANTMVVSSHGFPSSSPFSPPTGMTEFVDRSSLTRPDNLGVTLELNYVPMGAAGATGAKTATAAGGSGTDPGEGAAHILALREDAGVASFSISTGGATGSTCVAKNITITALTSGGATMTSYTGSINITTSTGRGDWATVSANGTLSNGTSDDGAATYTYVAGDNGSITLALTHTLAQQLTVTVVDSVVSSATATSSTVSFSDNAFVFTEDLTSRIAGADVAVAGRAHDYSVTLYRRDVSQSPANCAVATSYSGSKSLKAWITRSVTDPGGAAPAIGATSLGNTQPGANNLSLSFTSGVAAFNLTTTDVGKFAINFRDDSTTGLTAAITGSSNALTVRPFAMVVSAIQRGATANPNVNTATGSVFTQAGEAFQATVAAYRHNGSADSNNDGLPDAAATLAQTTGGGLAPSFAYATSLAAASAYTPASGVLGTLSNGSLAAGVFTGGTSTPTTLSYSEVGSFTLTLAVTSYLGSAGVDLSGTMFNATGAQNAVIGRFTPYDFGISLNTPSFTPGCSSNTAFTYIGQAFVFGTAPVITLTARNKAGGTTRNYTGNWWKISNSTLNGRAYTAASGTLDLSGLPATSADPTIVDLGGASSGQGTLTFSAGTGLRFTRAAPVAPFNAEVSLALNVLDSDGISYGSNPARFGAASAGNGIAFSGTGGGKSMRWGRLTLSNAISTEFADLRMPVEAQYYNGTSFVLNSDDGCTSFAKTAVAFQSFQRNLAACETFLSTIVTSVTLSGGKSTLTLTKPGSGNTGSVDLKPGLAVSDSGTACVSASSSAVASTAGGVNLTYLRSNWDPLTPAAYDKNPTGRAVFGIPHVPKEFIFSRENY